MSRPSPSGRIRAHSCFAESRYFVAPLSRLAKMTEREHFANEQITCKDAIKKWAEKTGKDPTKATKVSLIAQLPSIKRLDNNINILAACEHLSLSTNQIDRIISMPGLRNLKILSLGRNQIKRIEKLEEVSGTLEQLWLSYNSIEKLDGLSACKKLKTLYLSNNQIKSFDELLKLRENPVLEELLLVGNPLYDGVTVDQRRVEVVKRIPTLKKLDAKIVNEQELDAANVDFSAQ